MRILASTKELKHEDGIGLFSDRSDYNECQRHERFRAKGSRALGDA